MPITRCRISEEERESMFRAVGIFLHSSHKRYAFFRSYMFPPLDLFILMAKKSAMWGRYRPNLLILGLCPGLLDHDLLTSPYMLMVEQQSLTLSAPLPDAKQHVLGSGHTNRRVWGMGRSPRGSRPSHNGRLCDNYRTERFREGAEESNLCRSRRCRRRTWHKAAERTIPSRAQDQTRCTGLIPSILSMSGLSRSEPSINVFNSVTISTQFDGPAKGT